MRNIGDMIYTSTYERRKTEIVCPDCLGAKVVHVTLADGTVIEIECGGCDPGGYHPSSGYITQYEYVVVAKQMVIIGIEMSTSGVKYNLNTRELSDSCSYYVKTSTEIFDNKLDAIQHGEVLRSEHEDEENKRFLAKTKNHKTWAWNYSYHMKAAKRLRKEIEYHERKAVICKGKDKKHA